LIRVRQSSRVQPVTKGRYRLNTSKEVVEELRMREEVFWVEITKKGESQSAGRSPKGGMDWYLLGEE
jgi:hypothetical protein